MTFDVWMKVPGSRETTGWSRVASGVSLEEADVYENTCHFEIHIEEHKSA